MYKPPEEEEPIQVPAFKEAQTDYVSAVRSRTMSRVRGKDTKAERKLRQALWQMGYRYRKNVKSLPGTPDIAIKKYKLAVFVDGEFWHGYHWAEKKESIQRNRGYWIPKIERNMQRDRQVTQELQAMGWTVFRFWEGRLKTHFHLCLQAIVDELEKRKHR
jgi:DNA mismatch endonuclease (patch repair protein)